VDLRETDWNVPVINSEQMYEGMKRLGRTTHSSSTPDSPWHYQASYVKDRFERYLAWYGKYVKGEAGGGENRRED